MGEKEFVLLPVEEELRSRLSRLIKLRWVALGCILIAVWVTEYVPNISLPFREIYLICLAIFAYNFAFYVFLRRTEGTGSNKLFSRFAAIQISVDWIALTLFIHYTGGIESPVILFFFFHALLSIILLPSRLFYLQSTFGVLLLGTVAILEYNGAVGHVTLTGFLAGPRFRNPVYVFGMLFFFATALYVSTFLSAAIIKELRERDRQLLNLLEDRRQALQRIQTLYDLSHNVSSTLDLQEALDLATQSTAEVMKVKGCSVRILDRSRKKYELGGAHGLSEAYLQKGDLDPDKSLPDVLQGEAVFVRDVAKDPRIQYPEEAKREGIVSMLAVPLAFKQEIIGSLRIHLAEFKEFTTEETEFLSAIANTVSVAIANAMAFRKLLEFDHDRSRFMMMVAHEMRAPVTAIQGILRILLDDYLGGLTPKQKELLLRAETRTFSFLSLINDLLELGSDKNEPATDKLAAISLDEVLMKVLGLLEVKSREKNIAIEVERPEGSLAFAGVEGDMETLFTNLIGNAVKYTPPGGQVLVQIQLLPKTIQIAVSDTGIGIPREELPHVFEEFFRAKNARNLEREGTGLGLPIVKRIVDRYGGQIFVNSTLGKGTTATAVFPKEKIRLGGNETYREVR